MKVRWAKQKDRGLIVKAGERPTSAAALLCATSWNFVSSDAAGGGVTGRVGPVTTSASIRAVTYFDFRPRSRRHPRGDFVELVFKREVAGIENVKFASGRSRR